MVATFLNRRHCKVAFSLLLNIGVLPNILSPYWLVGDVIASRTNSTLIPSQAIFQFFVNRYFLYDLLHNKHVVMLVWCLQTTSGHLRSPHQPRQHQTFALTAVFLYRQKWSVLTASNKITCPGGILTNWRRKTLTGSERTSFGNDWIRQELVSQRPSLAYQSGCQVSFWFQRSPGENVPSITQSHSSLFHKLWEKVGMALRAAVHDYSCM